MIYTMRPRTVFDHTLFCLHWQIVNNILFDKADKIVKSSLDTISDSRVGQVSSVEESMVARGVELFEKGLKHRQHDKHTSTTETV